ncbi:DEAD/DEAH box helicase [Sphaerimonospora sp. CA-214678]|uniref:DEAD/DEAH box helicase n=1 Tax=Sphaerimonospora sp. CA-214678 TaxID=3240029 RepID=UPI003D92B73D
MAHDLRYQPSLQELGWLCDLPLATCLVVGDVADDARDAFKNLAPEVRGVQADPIISHHLHEGAYAIESKGSWHGVLVLSARLPVAAEDEERQFTLGGHLGLAQMVYQAKWNEAQPFAGNACFRVGDMVQPEGERLVGTITQVIPQGAAYLYEVDLRGELHTYTEGSLTPVQGDPSRPEFWLSQSPANAADLSLTLTWTKLTHPLTDTLYSFASSKTVFRAYQFKPVLKMLTGSSGRILIADEVGLGKTIEAGLIWSELEQRRKLDRVLVVVPSVLKYKWQAEMRRRFDRTLDLVKASDLAEFAEALDKGDDGPLHAVISIESLRTADEVLEKLAELKPRFDLVIIDEAHNMRNRGRKSHLLGELLASWSDHLVLLSATPLNLGNDDLFTLMNLLDPGSFNDRDTFERQMEPNAVLNDVARALVDNRSPRELLVTLDRLDQVRFGRSITDRPDYDVLRKVLDVDHPLTPEEKARVRRLLADLNMLSGHLTRTRKADVPEHKAVREPRNIDVEWTEEERVYYDAVYAWAYNRARRKGVPPGFIMQMPLRQAASCIPASQKALRAKGPALFEDEIDDLDGDSEGLDADDLEDLLSQEFGWVEVDTKYDRLQEELLKLREQFGVRQMMIFSYFRGTLSYLAERLSAHFTYRVMHGGVKQPDRQQIMQEFRDGAFEILLLSEVGSEGLDFEFCNVLVNYDLPWNPMRVEQRIGRLDRFGQEHEKILIYNMRVPGTIETDIFQRLYDRIGIFQNSVGELEPILRDHFVELMQLRLSPAELDRKISNLAIAVEQRSQDTDDLRASRAILSGLDGLLVEGFTEHGPGNGRFIGSSEIQRIIDQLFERYGARRGEPDDKGVLEIVGTSELAAKFRAMPDQSGSTLPPGRLAWRLQIGEPLKCTFHPETASKYDTELFSARHPLVRLAIRVLAEDRLALPRFGTIGIPGVPEGCTYLMAIHLVETSGLRPTLELWVTAIDLETREVVDGLGDALLTALADGSLTDSTVKVPRDLTGVWRVAQQYVGARLVETERIRRQENEALVDARIRAKEHTLDLQIRKNRELLESVPEARIRRMRESHLAKLAQARQIVREELSAQKALSVSMRPIAAALVSSAAAPNPSDRTPSRPLGRAEEGR